MSKVKELIGKLSNLSDVYRGNSKQKDIYSSILDELRRHYNLNKKLF
jgi:hypothetical protein